MANFFADLIAKFNPYHGKDGRFTSANGATSFTYSPGKSKAHDAAIEREKERAAQAETNTKAEARRISSDEAAEKYAEDDYKRYTLSPDEKHAMKEYTGTTYEPINNSLRNGGDGGTYKKEVDALTDAINKTSVREAVVSYRGMSDGAANALLKQAGASNFDELVGRVISDKGFVSTTLSENTAREFGRYIFETTLPKGSKALMPNGDSYSPWEHEVILQRGARFNITGTRKQGSIIYIQTEYVGA